MILHFPILDISTVCRSVLRRGMIRMSGFTVQRKS